MSASMRRSQSSAKVSSNHRAKIASIVGCSWANGSFKLAQAHGNLGVWGRHVQYRALTVRWQGQQEEEREPGAGRGCIPCSEKLIFNIWFGPEKNGIPAKGRDEVNPLKVSGRPADGGCMVT